jgi:hypothetical protein
MQALSDLRAARWMISHRPETTWQKTQDEDRAVTEIDNAINRIKTASIDDGKDINYHAPVDEQPKQIDRLRKAIEYLNAAYADINKEEDNGGAQGLKNQAMAYIADAKRYVNIALTPVHPNYMEALSDLRSARWMIDHHTGNNWKQNQDETEAVRQIDGAINEIKRAAIDDGKDLNYHPKADETPDRIGRLHKAVDLLRLANAAISKEEDNPNARGLRNAATQFINAAIGSTEKALKQ